MISRRKWMVGAAAAAHAFAAQPKGFKRVANALADTSRVPGRPDGILIESHIHLFAGDPERFPYNGASYKPHTAPVEDYVKFAREAQINHAVIVHPEPYQDDHRYLEYSLAHEASPGFFKGTCLFDPIDPATPKRMQALVEKNPGRIVALRIHEIHAGGNPFHHNRGHPRSRSERSADGGDLARGSRTRVSYSNSLHPALRGAHRRTRWQIPRDAGHSGPSGPPGSRNSQRSTSKFSSWQKSRAST